MRYTLKDVTDELYKQTRSRNFSTPDALTNFYNNQSKNFNECITALNLDEEIEWIKVGGNFSFNESDRDFWIIVLKEFTKKMDPIRRATDDNLDIEFVVWLYEGVIDVFRRAEIENDKLSKVASKINQRLNYSICKHKSIIESMQNKMRELIEKNIDTPSFVLGNYEMNQWLIGLESDFSAFISKWADLFHNMKEIRNCELDDIIEQATNELSPEESAEAVIDFTIAEVITERLEQHEEYSNLNKEQNRILGFSEDGSLNKKIKKPHVVKVEKKFNFIKHRLNNLYTEIRHQVVSEFAPNYIKEEYETKELDFSSLMSAEELLKKAIEQQKEDWADEKHRKLVPQIDLPDIDFEELRKQLEYSKL